MTTAAPASASAPTTPPSSTVINNKLQTWQVPLLQPPVKPGPGQLLLHPNNYPSCTCPNCWAKQLSALALDFVALRRKTTAAKIRATFAVNNETTGPTKVGAR